MSKFLKRGVAALLCLCLMLSVMPRVQAAQGSGSFYFCVMTANRVIVEPEAISYTAGQTVEEAIAASGHKLERIEDGSIVAIDGVSAMYLRYYDGGGYDMTKPASEITAMFFCVNDVYSDAMIDLLARWAASVRRRTTCKTTRPPRMPTPTLWTHCPRQKPTRPAPAAMP